MIAQKIALLKTMLTNPDKESLKLSLNNCHAKGVVSIPLKGTPGSLKRVFIATEGLMPGDVQYHTHKYNIVLTSIKGAIKHFVGIKDNAFHWMPKSQIYSYSSSINGTGEIKFIEDHYFNFSEFLLPTPSTTNLRSTIFHTMACDIDSMWLVEESSDGQQKSQFIGRPFEISDDMYTKIDPKDLQIYIKKIYDQVVLLFNSMKSDINISEILEKDLNYISDTEVLKLIEFIEDYGKDEITDKEMYKICLKFDRYKIVKKAKDIFNYSIRDVM